MKVEVVYARPQAPLVVDCQVEGGTTVAQVIERSGVLRYCPDIDLKTQRVGVFGKLVKLDAQVRDGDRIEIYQRITRVLDDDDDDDD